MKGLALFFESEKGQRLKNTIIGVGASVVMIGALFKLQSWPGAGGFLIVGLCTEAFIFLLQGVLPPHPNYHWEKFYPGITISPELEELEHGKPLNKGKSVSEQLDDMLENANIETKLIERLGANLGKLGDNVAKMNELGDASIATKEYAQKTKEAVVALNDMKNAYATATASIQTLSESTGSFKKYNDQIIEVSSKLAALNSVYEVELKETTSGLKSLNKNLAGLNSVYGNMLSAMTIKG